MNYAINEDDIKNYLGNQVKIIEYKQLKNVSDLESFMQVPFLFLLYEHKPNFGHWTCIIKNDIQYTFEFFDSYGTKPDLQLLDLPIRLRNSLGQESPELASLLFDSNRKIIYNSNKLQSENQKIQTCGKWCILRCSMFNIPVNTFADLFLHQRVMSDKVLQKLWISYVNEWEGSKNIKPVGIKK